MAVHKVMGLACSLDALIHDGNQRSSLSSDPDDFSDDDTASVCESHCDMHSSCEISSSLTSPGDDVESGVSVWDVDQVLILFRRCKFPTEGIVANNVDGPALLSLYADADAEEMFTAPVPDGLGFNKLLFTGRFKNEMAKLSYRLPSSAGVTV